MKKRIALIVLCVTLVFSLAVGGTLMLFTAQSETATNVVTMGNAKLEIVEEIFEKDSPDGEGNFSKWYNNLDPKWNEVDNPKEPNSEGDFTLEDVMPGDYVLKRVVLANRGTTDLYLYTEFEFEFSTNGLSAPDIKALTDALLDGFSAEDTKRPAGHRWHGITPNDGGITTTDSKLTGRGGYFFVRANEYISESNERINRLATADENVSGIASIHYYFKIPTSLTSAEGLDLTIKVTAYGLQADNNPLTDYSTLEGSDPWDFLGEGRTAFADNFEELGYLRP